MRRFFYAAALVFLACAPATAQSLDQRSEALRKSLWVTNYQREMRRNPFLFLDHIVRHHSLLPIVQNTPQSLKWNRAKQLLDVNEFNDAVNEIFGDGSAFGIGLSAHLGPVELELDAGKLVGAFSQRFMTQSDLNAEAIEAEVNDMVMADGLVRGLGSVIYDSYFGNASYAPLNSLSTLASAIKVLPDSSPEEFLAVEPALIRTAFEARLADASPQIGDGSAQDWDVFYSVFVNTFGISAENANLVGVELVSSLDLNSEEGQIISLDPDSYKGVLLEGSLEDEFKDFFGTIIGSVDSGGSSTIIRSRASEAEAWEQMNEFSAHLSELANFLPREERVALLMVSEFVNLAATVNKINDLKFQQQSQQNQTQVVNASLSLVTGVLGIISLAQSLQDSGADPHMEALHQLLLGQQKIMKQLRQISKDVLQLRVILAAVEHRILRSNFESVEQIFELRRQVEELRQVGDFYYDFERESFQNILVQNAQIANRYFRGLSGSDHALLHTPTSQSHAAALNSLVFDSISEAPFVFVPSEPTSELLAPNDDVGALTFAARTALSVSDDAFSNSTSEDGRVSVSNTSMERYLEFLQLYEASMAEQGNPLGAVNSEYLLYGLQLIADSVAWLPQGSARHFEPREYRALLETNELGKRRVVELAPIIFASLAHNSSKLAESWEAQLQESRIETFGEQATPGVIELVLSDSLSRLRRVLACAQSDNFSRLADVTESSQCDGLPLNWGMSVAGEEAVPLLVALNLISDQRQIRLLGYDRDRSPISIGNPNEVCPRPYCRTDCANTANEFPWSDRVLVTYPEDALNQAHMGVILGTASVCSSYPGPTLSHADDNGLAAITSFYHSFRCINSAGAADCQSILDDGFKEIWDRFFDHQATRLYFAGQTTFDPPRNAVISNSNTNWIGALKRSVDTSANNEALISASIDALGRIIDQEALSYQKNFRTSLQDGEFFALIERIDREINALVYLSRWLNPECQIVVGNTLSNLLSLDNGDPSTTLPRAFADIQGGDFGRLRDFDNKVRGIGEGSFPDTNLLDDCYVESPVSFTSFKLVEFLEKNVASN